MANAMRSSNTLGLGTLVRDPIPYMVEPSGNMMFQEPGGNVVWVNFARRPHQASDAARLVFEMAIRPLERELESYMQLEDGWDGPRSRAPSRGAVDAALAFLATISPASRLPDVAAGADGEVNVSWRGPDHFVDLSFYDETGGSLFLRAAARMKVPSGIKSFDDLPIQAHSAILVA